MKRQKHIFLACALIWLAPVSDASAQLQFKDWQVVPAGRRAIRASDDQGSGAASTVEDLKVVVPAGRRDAQPPPNAASSAAATSSDLKVVIPADRRDAQPTPEPDSVAAAASKKWVVQAGRRETQPLSQSGLSTAITRKNWVVQAGRLESQPPPKQDPGSRAAVTSEIWVAQADGREVQPTPNPGLGAARTKSDSQLMAEHRKVQLAAHRGSAATSISGVNSSLPVMPMLPRRDFETPDQPIRTERRPADQGPFSRFAESLEGTDAAIELIVGQGRLFRTKQPIVNTVGVSVVAIGDPTVVDFDLLPDSKTLRLRGMRVGVTDMTFVTIDGTAYSFEIHVLYDLPLVQSHLRQIFPTAHIELKQLREHVIVEGEARSLQQVSQIIEVITAYLGSLQVTQSQSGSRVSGGAIPARDGRGNGEGNGEDGEEPLDPNDPEAGDLAPGEEGEGEGEGDARAAQGIPTEVGGRSRSRARSQAPQVINLLKVPNNQQVMLKVQIAELNRRAIREIGVDFEIGDPAANFFQSIAGGTLGGNLIGTFPESNWNILINALRENSVATILAEPNLVTLSGHTATFQSGGEFGFDVVQGFGAVSTQFKPFGVLLSFTPFVLDDGRIRLQVAPEVSNVDFTLTTGSTPGLRTRNASTTVNLREGQTLAIAGLLQLDRTGTTSRVPLVGDIPVVGNIFSDNRYDVLERELLVIVTPHLVDPLESADAIPLPGEEILEPNDLEFYLINRIEGRTCRPHRSTTNWDAPLDCLFQMRVEQSYTAGPVGLSR